MHQITRDEKPFRFFIGPSKHQVLKVFKGQTLKEMKSISFNSLYSVEPREESDFSTPIIFENKFPALTESKIGKGKVILFVSSIDRDWNNFPIQPTFLPWVQRWVKYSARGLDSLVQKELLVGDPFYWKKQLKNSKNYITSPRGKVVLLSSKGDKIEFKDTYRPGIYLLYRGPLTSSPKEETATHSQIPHGARPVGSFTVNIDPKESLSVKISNEEIKDLLPEANITFSDGYQEREANKSGEGVPMSSPFIFLVGSMLLLEGWLIRKE